MRIFITGSTGLIGSALCHLLIQQQYQVDALVRSVDKAKSVLPPQVKLIPSLDTIQDFNQYDAVINLAGEPIFSHYWSKKQQYLLRSSRLDLTAQLSEKINQSSKKPVVFISASAMGYYGDQGNSILDETAPFSPLHTDFAAQLCKEWEFAAQQAQTRVCLLRTGIVFTQQRGAFAQMRSIYRLGLGGKIGNGQQYWAWIALEDMLQAILFLLQHNECEGAFNLVAPHPLQNAQINQQLGKKWQRPCFASVPAFVLKLMLGERAKLLLDSQNARPAKLLQQGFQFRYPDFPQFLADL